MSEKPKPPPATCDSCIYYDRVGTFFGYCHRRAPAPKWPQVMGREWCGEHEWIPEKRPCMDCSLPVGKDALNYSGYIICKACDDLRPRFDATPPQPLPGGSPQSPVRRVPV